MTRLVAGIDGGQSSTIAVIGDERGRILGRGASGPADEIGVTAESTRLHDALLGALDDASRRAHLPSGSRFDAIVAGVSGYNGRVYGRAPQLPAERFALLHDAPIAHAAALGGKPGVIVIAGTGSVVYTPDAGGTPLTLGGWGFLFGDEGSAFRIACDALAALMRAQDDGDASFTEELRAAQEFFAMDTLRQIGRAFYRAELTRDRVAAFAQIALRFESFRPIANRGAERLASLAVIAIKAGAAARVGLSGGVLRDTQFRQRVTDAIVASVPEVEIVVARCEPAEGALRLAYRELGLEVGELHE